MKPMLAVLLLLSGFTLPCSAQPVRITGWDRAGNLSWTNLICAAQPVYEVLRANSLTSPWTHWAFVTNQTSVSISDALSETGSVFCRIAWVDEPTAVFDYSFTEAASAAVTVTGRLEIPFAWTSVGRRSFVEADIGFSRLHPLGDAPLGRLPYSPDGVTLRLYVKGSGTEDSVYLDGQLERSTTNGVCAYTRYAGTVWYVGFVEQELGTFVATRAQ